MRDFFLPAFLFLSVGFSFLQAKNVEPNVLEKINKADYVFLESQVKNSTEDLGAYFDLLRHAYALNPSDNTLNKELGFYYFLLGSQDSHADSAVIEKGYEMMKSSYLSDPSDYYSSAFFASISQHIGKTDESLSVWETLDSLYPNKPDAAINHAEALFNKGDTASIKKALAIYGKLEKTQGKSMGLSSQKIRSYLTMKDTANTIAELNSLLEKFPRNSDNYIFSGDVYMAISKPDKALENYNRAIEIDSANGLAYHKLADYYLRTNDSIGYDREVFNALSQGNLDVNDKIGLMRGYVQNLYTDSLQYPRIEKLFDVLTELHPLEPEIRDLYSAYLAVTGNYAASALQTEISLGLNPMEQLNWNRLLSLELQTNEYDKATETGMRAIHYFPDDPYLYLLTSSAFLMADSAQNALPLLQKALGLTDSHDYSSLSNIECTLGDTYYKLNMPDSAFIHYDIALEYDPTNLLAMNNCAYYLACENKDLDRAEKLSYKTIQEEPENPTSLDTYAWVLFKLKRFNDAKIYIDKAFELDEEPSAELYEHAGDIYFMNLLPSDAMNFWKKSLELQPENKILQRKIKEKIYIPE